MKTFKKLFSVSAIVALLGTLAPFYAFGATYSDELQEAYEYAYAKNVTTMTSIDNANMYGSLTRIAMAKMIANYATTVLNLEEVDNAGECTFSDVTASLDAQYDNGVTNACKLGLMGQNITAFRPNDPVTRGEFGTTLSRALNRANGNTIEEGTPYYENHLAYLKSEGIMNDISNPSATEVRGYVMLMMMRADDNYVAPSESGKCTLEERVDCLLNSDDTEACLAACSGEEPAEEDLPGYATVSAKAAADQTVALNAVDKKIGTVTLKAGENDTTVTALEITKAGLGDARDIATISLMKNGEYVTNSATLTNKVAKLRFRPNLTLKANGSDTFDVVVSMAGAGIATAGGTHDFSVTAVTVSNGTFGGTPAKLGGLTTTNYSVEAITVSTPTAVNVDAGDTDVELATIELKAGADADLDSITLTSENNPDDLYDILKNVKAYIDDEVVGNVTVNAETLVINGLSTELKKSKTLSITLKGDVAVADTMTATLDLEGNHVVATEKSTNERMTSNARSYTLNIGNGAGLTFKNNVKKLQTVAKNTEDVVLFDANITAASNVEILSYTLDIANYTVANSGYLEDLRVSVDGDEYDLGAFTFTTSPDKGSITLNDKYLNAFTIDANKTVNVQVLGTTHTGETNAYNVTFSVNTLKNLDTNNTITPATKPSVKGHSTKIGAGEFEVSKNTIAGSTIKIGEETSILAFDLTAKSEAVKTINATVNVTELNDTGYTIIDKVSLGGKTVELEDSWVYCEWDDDNDGGTTPDVPLYTGYANINKCTADTVTGLDFNFTALGTIANGATKGYTVAITTDDDVESSFLGVKYTAKVTMSGIGDDSNDTIVTATSDAPKLTSKGHQLVTEKNSVEVNQNAEFIYVKVTNNSDYDITLKSGEIKVLSNKDKEGNVLLPALETTFATVFEDNKDGDTLAWTWGTTKLPGTATFTTTNPVISKGKSATYAIRLNSTTTIDTDDYVATVNSITFNYDGSTVDITENF